MDKDIYQIYHHKSKLIQRAGSRLIVMRLAIWRDPALLDQVTVIIIHMYCYNYPTGLQQSKIGTLFGTEIEDFDK